VNSIIQETQIFGPIGIFAHYLDKDEIIVEKHENYQKRSFRNRYDILTTNGYLRLTIPLCKGKNNKMPIAEVKIAYDDNWVDIHLQTIRSAYGKSPYFEFYFDGLEKIFAKKHSLLFDFNMECMLFIFSKLKLSNTISTSNSYEPQYDNLVDLRNKKWDDLQDHSSYVQVWEDKFGFTPNLSVLDLLFCMGPESISYLRKIEQKIP
jgi:WbqC-like protein family